MGLGEGAEGALMKRMAKPAPSRIFNCRFPGEEQYEVVCKIGKGSYGTVVKARCRGTGEDVAIKHIDRVFADPADAVRTIRELRFLRMLKHPSIVGVSTVLHPANPARFDDIFIVTELLDSDLAQLIRRREPITAAQKRWLAYQLFEGLAYIHEAHIYHRDLKPANLLVSAPDADGRRTLKICDFGLARASFEDSGPAAGDREEGPVLWTDYVATRWYRAPELICSYRGGCYDGSIDVWAAGCIIAELWRGRALFPARNMYHQLDLITAFVGSPKEVVVDRLRNKKAKTYLTSLKPREPSNMSKMFSEQDVLGEEPTCGLADAFELLSSLLNFNPARRIDAHTALLHQYFADCVQRRVCAAAAADMQHLGVPVVQPRREDFSFESKEHKLSVPELRNTLYREILHFTDHTPASPNFAPISSAQVKTQMKVLSLDGSTDDLEALPRMMASSSSMPGPQMSQLAAGVLVDATTKAMPAPSTGPLKPVRSSTAKSMCPTSAGPPSLARPSSVARSERRSASPSSPRGPPTRGRGRAQSPANRCRSRSRSPARSGGLASSADACESQLLSVAAKHGGLNPWGQMTYDMGMFGDLSTIGVLVGSNAPGFCSNSPTAPETPPPSSCDVTRSPPEERGIGKAIGKFFDRMLAVRTMAYANGMHSDAAEWMSCVDPGY